MKSKAGTARNARIKPSADAASRSAKRSDFASVYSQAASLSLSQRLKIREDFFRRTDIDVLQFLAAFDAIAGLDYLVKDIWGRTLVNTLRDAPRNGARSEEQFVGRTAGEYLTRSLAEHYEADDQTVIRTGQPLRNIIEIRLDALGVPDWIVTDKYPLRDVRGEIVGIIGTMQSLRHRMKGLPHLGEVGIAAEYIRENLRGAMALDNIASHVGISKRHLQRLFRQAIGMSVHQFVIRSRIHFAARQLTQVSHPLAEIALQCGFTDQSAFTNTFRKVLGLAPREYRKRFLQDYVPRAQGK
jgi:AraC-like DNA-binding protein